jgi:type IV pilus assembly protein PilC
MEYLCTVGTAEGRVVEEVLDARSEVAARQEMERLGYHVFKIRARGWPSWLALPTLGRKRKIPQQALLVFNQELAALLKSGLPVLQAIELMYDRQREPLFKEILGDIRRRVRDGQDLSAAVSNFGDLFPALYAPTLKAGEQSGELEQVLRRFIRYQKLIGEARRKVVSALVYPAVLIGLSCLLILIMAIYVVPKFSEFFRALRTELPLLTRATLGFSAFMSRHWIPVLVIVVVTAVVGRQWSRFPCWGPSSGDWRFRSSAALSPPYWQAGSRWSRRSRTR